MKYSKNIYSIFKENKCSELIGELDTKIDFYEVDDTFIISTITDKVTKNSYVASPYVLIIEYSKDELDKIDSKLQKLFAKLLIKCFDTFFKFSQIDKMQTLNNYMLSTNFFPKVWEELDIKKLETKANACYPNHGLIIRSVNKFQNLKLYNNLVKNGWIAIPSRQVYIFSDREIWRKRRNTINDKKLLKSNRFYFYQLVTEDCFSLYTKAEKLYNYLYLEKYSKHNIQFKAKYLQQMVEKELLDLYLLKDTNNEKYVGVVGITQEDNIMTVPIVGYDMTYPQKDALYRRLIMFALSYAMERKSFLNLSSGAPQFKLLRGAIAEQEYMFVKIDNLSIRGKLAWHTIAFFAKYFYEPILRKFKL